MLLQLRIAGAPPGCSCSGVRASAPSAQHRTSTTAIAVTRINLPMLPRPLAPIATPVNVRLSGRMAIIRHEKRKKAFTRAYDSSSRHCALVMTSPFTFERGGKLMLYFMRVFCSAECSPFTDRSFDASRRIKAKRCMCIHIACTCYLIRTSTSLLTQNLPSLPPCQQLALHCLIGHRYRPFPYHSTG